MPARLRPQVLADKRHNTNRPMCRPLRGGGMVVAFEWHLTSQEDRRIVRMIRPFRAPIETAFMKTRKKPNYRLLIGLLVVFAVVGTSVHFVHAFQIKRNAK